MNYLCVLLLLLISPLCLNERIYITPPLEKTEEKVEAYSVSYGIQLKNKGDKTFMRVFITPESMDNIVYAFVNTGEEEPGMRTSQYKCLEKTCYIWIPLSGYSEDMILSMHTECNTKCHYHYAIDYFDAITIEDNAHFEYEINTEGNMEIVYPIAQSINKFMLFIKSTGYEDIEVLLSDNSTNEQTYFKMESIVFNGFGIIIEDKAVTEGKKYLMEIIVLRPTIITVGNKNLPNDNAAVAQIHLLKPDYSILNYKLNYMSECYSVSIPVPVTVPENETKIGPFVLNASSATNNAHVYIQNSQTQEVVQSKDIINSDVFIFSYEQINNNKLCFKRMDNNINDYVSLQFQLIDLNNLLSSQPQITHLDRGVFTKGYLPRNNILYYRLSKYFKHSSAQIKTYLKMQLQVIKGNPVLYHYHCEEYPYCQVKPEDMQIISYQLSQGSKVNDNYYHSINVNNANPYHNIIQDTAFVHCPDDSECLYNVVMQNEYEDNTMLFNNEPILTYISPEQTINYSFEINSADITGINVELYSFIGKANFTFFPSNDSGKYIFDGSKEVFFLSSEDGADIKGTYAIKVKGVSNAFYTIHYSSKTKETLFKENIIKSGETMLTTISKKEMRKTVSYTNQIPNSNSFVTITTMNCNTRIKYKNTEYTDRTNQILIQSNEIEQHEINIELISLDTQSLSETEKCLVYSIGKESSNEHKVILNEGIKHAMQLTEIINTVTYIHPFYRNNNDKDNENIIIIINKQSEGKITISYNFNTNPPISVDLVMIQNKKFVLQQSLIQKYCQLNNICRLFIQIQSTESSLSSYPIDYDITILNNHQIPIYLYKNNVTTNSLFNNKQYHYYYSDIGYNQQGEIKFNVMKGQGNLIAKIVAKDTQEEEANWNRRIKLPIQGDKNLLPYNYYDNQIAFTLEDTKNCQNAGCEIYIGVYSDTIDLVEYNLSINTHELIQLKPNEFAYGLIAKDIGQFYTVYIPTSNTKLMIEFNNQFGVCYIKLGKEKPSANDHTWSFKGNDRLFEISSSDEKIKKESLKGLYFSFGLFSLITSHYDLNYTFKVALNQKSPFDIIEGKIGENFQCKTNNDRCYFSFPVNSYYKVIDLALYAKNEDVFSNKIAIYSSFFDGDKYEKFSVEELKQKLPNEKQSDYSSKAQFNSDYLIIHFTPQGEEVINGFLLITVVSGKNGRLILSSSLNKAALSINLKPQNPQLFYLEENKDMKLNILGDTTYSVNIKRIEGYGTVSNNIKEREYVMGEKQVEVSMIVKSPIDSPAQISVVTKQKMNFLFLIQYVMRPENNIDVVPYGNTIFIENQKDTSFPLSYYFPIYDKDNDITVNFSYEAFEFGHELDLGNQQFDIQGFITNEDIIIKLKNNPSSVTHIGSKLETSFDYSLKIGVLCVKSSDINDYSSIENKYIYITIAPSKKNDNEYKYFSSKIYVSLTTASSIPIESQSNRYYFSQLINQKPQFIKMMKRKENDSLMEINAALADDRITYTVNTLPDNLNDVEYEKNNTNIIVSSKEMNGFSRITIDLSKTSAGVLFTVFKIDKEEVLSGHFAVEYITFSNQISHLSFLKNPIYNVTNNTFVVSFDSAVNEKQEPTLANYALKLYKKTTDNEVLNKTNTFYTYILPDAMYSLNRVLTPNVTFKGELPTKDEYYFSIVTRTTIKRNNDFIEEYYAFPIYVNENHKIEPKSSDMWIYIFSAIGGVVLIAGIGILIWYIVYKKKHQGRNTQSDYKAITNAVDNLGI